MNGVTTSIAALDEPDLTDSQVTGLALLRDGEILTNPAYRNATGVDSRLATAELGDLVARELLHQVGERRWSRYVLSPRVEQLGTSEAKTTRRLSRADRRREILEALGIETLRRIEIQERTGLPDKTVARWLNVLRKEQAVDLISDTASGRDARYRRRTESPTLFDEQR